MGVIIDNAQYIVKDSTKGEYQNRMEGNSTQNWETKWDFELKLVSLTLNGMKLTNVIIDNDKKNDDYYKAIRVKNRHLKLLKLHLGILTKEDTGRIVKKEPLIYRNQSLLFQLNPLQSGTANVHDKTLEIDGIKYKKRELFYTELTPEKEEIMREYNEKLAAFKAYQQEVLKNLFN